MHSQVLNDKLKLTRRVIISGIGTGGHYYPALVVALEFLRFQAPVVFLVRDRSPEQEMAINYGIATRAINPRGYFGKSLLAKIESLFSILISIIALHGITKRSIGVAFGGYGAVPLILSCMINRCPFFLFEANRIPGRATRLFSNQAKAIFLGLGSNVKINGRAFITGIPVRREFKQPKFANRPVDHKTILIYGGSQGSRFLNQKAIDLQRLLSGSIRLRIVSGKRDYDWIRANIIEPNSVIPYTQMPWDEIDAADVIVSRAGALAGYEISISGKPIIFIPFPYAIDNHQYYNAQYFSMLTGAVIIEEKDATLTRLADEIQKSCACTKRRDCGLIADAETRIFNIVKEIS